MPHPTQQAERFEALDGLRGLAALTVVTSHLIHTLSAPGWLHYTAFFCSQAAVLLFFILSGFVLALPFLRGPVAAGPFWVRRFFRIWPTYIVAMGLAAGLMLLYPTRGTERLVDPWLWANQLVLITSFDSGVLNGVVWSLVHEMRMSLLFPLLMGALVLAPVGRVAALAVGSSLFGMAAYRLLGGTDYPMTFHYGALFLLGFLLARHREALVAWWTARSRGLLLATAAAVYSLSGAFAEHMPPGVVWQLLVDWAIALAAATLLVAALAPGRWQACLRHPLCAFLGAVSYSLYLVHLPLIRVVAFHLLAGAPPFAIAAATLLASLGVAYACYRLVELPTMALGRKLAAWRPSPAAVRPVSEV